MSTIKVGTLLAADGSTTTQPSIPALDKRMAKAWVNFNGVGTVAIRDDYGVSSITDNGTGLYKVNFSTLMTNGNYVAIVTGTNGDGAASTTTGAYVYTETNAKFNINVNNGNGAARDREIINAIVFDS
tara:strand:+ start:273 stop:656 length:384 start_codon:yes stop_codon:yes gene_type:complete